MVKRKRTLSVKDNSENVNQTSDAGLISEAKRSKVTDHPLRAERQDNGVEHSSSLQNLTMPPTSQTSLNSSGSSGETVPLSISQSLPNVPLPAAPIVPQSRPTPQLRTSARVLNKLRREETKADLANITATASKKADSNVKTEFPEEEDGNRGSGNSEKKRRRTWELWSTEDKNIFFESINECGKDFEAIQNYVTTKLRKKGTPGYQIKNKDQVRHFYYRTWHKISKYITFSEGVKKVTQELYGLINYGELRKKIGSTLDERKAQKLQELIRKGSTSVRVKGKSVRVRTPICRALKKLNQIEEHREQREVRVPQSIVVEILPRSVEAWCRVQGLAHNPRVRVTTSPQKPLSTVLSHLQEKWRNANLKLRETLVSRVNFPLEIEPVKEPVLKLLPPAGCCIKPLNIQLELLMKSSAVSLQSHEARLRRCEEDLGKNEKRKESKQTGNKISTRVEDGFSKDAEESGRSGEQISEVEQSGTNSEGPKSDVNGSQGGNSNLSKGRDSEILNGDLDDYAGEASQEELEDGSDVEPDCLNSPEIDADDIVQLDNWLSLPVNVKEEPLDYLSPPTSVMDPLDLHDPDDPFDPDLKVKEEGESGDALRQLIALETVANSQNVDDDAEVVCIGESTRLTALVGKGHRGHSSGTNQGDLAPEERALVGTPEPEEEEKDLDSEEKPSTADVDKLIEKIRKGWTCSSVGGITLGELYLMFGQNKKVNLEYEFVNLTDEEKVDSPSSIHSSKESLSISPAKSVNSVTQIVAGLSTPTVSSVGLSSTGNANASIDSPTECKNPSPGSEDSQKKESKILSEEKHVSVENLSGMLQQLLSMARVILAKPPSDSCSCGHVCGRGGGGLRSPASGRGQGLCGVSRSPGNTKSPRNCRVGAVGAQSPGGVHSPISQPAGRSPLGAKSLKERTKPASAKKLIPDSVVEMDGKAELPLLNSSSSLNANSAVTGQDQGSKVPVTNIDSVKGVKVVGGSGSDGGEFRVPTAPAPRPVQAQQASFNAQLTKLLPQYNNRPGRRVLRKSFVVQRQLPLLPKARAQPAGVISMKVLPRVIQKFDLEGNQIKSYLPISKATSQGSQLKSSAQALNAHIVAASSLKIATPIQVEPTVNSNTLQLTSQHTLPLPQGIQTSMPVVSTNPPATNAISVNVSGQPLLTVELPAPVTSPTKQPGSLSGDNCLPGVVGVPPVTDISELLKPAVVIDNTQTQITNATKSPVKSSVCDSDNFNPLTPRKIDNLINSAVTLPQSFSYALSGDSKGSLSPVSTNATSSNTNINGILSSMVSEALSDLPDLSTPPGTPQLFCSTKSSGESTSFLSQLENISSSTSTTAAYPCIPSPSLFNSSISLDSLPSLNNGLPVNTQLVSAPPTTTTSEELSNVSVQMTSSLAPTSATAPLSLGTSLLSTATTSHLELSPPSMQTNNFSTLLNTPTPHATNNNPASSGGDISPTSLTGLLHSPSPGTSKNFSTLLDSNGRSSTSSLSVPELYIPEGSLNLPLLDISIGGTVSLSEQTSGLLNSGLDSKGADFPTNSAAKHSSSTSVRSSTPTPAGANESCIQGTSSEKLLDITLGISNSNSSFSSLLASATQPPKVLDSSILGALNMDNLDCGTESGNRGVVSNVLEGISNVEISGFPALDTSTPSPPPSPSRLLQQGDNQWLNNEVNDFSLSSFLGHFDSPIKGSTSRGASQSNPSELPMPSLVTVYNENSVDFTAKFAEMKAKASHTYKN